MQTSCSARRTPVSALPPVQRSPFLFHFTNQSWILTLSELDNLMELGYVSGVENFLLQRWRPCHSQTCCCTIPCSHLGVLKVSPVAKTESLRRSEFGGWS